MRITAKYNNTFGVIEISVDRNTDMDFMITEKKLVFTRASLALLLKVLLMTNIISPKLLLGVLEEYNTYKEEMKNA